MKKLKEVTIYTDGAYLPSTNVGGYGYILIYKAGNNILTKEGFGGVYNTTNNKMELKAIIEALNELTERCKVTVYSDSMYCVQGVNSWLYAWYKNNFKTRTGQDVKNRSEWEELHSLKQKHNLKMVWVKGHSGILYNELVDRLAAQGTQCVVKI